MSSLLFKSKAIVNRMTLIPPVLGFVQDMLIAGIFGADIANDAFFVAFKIPSFLQRLFAEDAFAHDFVKVATFACCPG